LFSENRDVEFIDFGRGYMHYFGHHFRDSYLTAINTNFEGVNTRHAITSKEFAQFERQEISRDHISSLEKALSKIKIGSNDNKKNRVIDTMNQYHSSGKPVFILFAHVFFDVAIEDNSPSFKDMSSWIEETIKYFRDKQALLVLKPHPAEIRKDFPNKAPVETLASFVKDIPRTSNILLLEPDLFTLKELQEKMTVGLIWRSSVALELACHSVPVIIAGKPNYGILNFQYCESRSHYFQCIENYKAITVSQALRSNALRYIYYLETKKNNYLECFKYDVSHNYYYWDEKAFKNYIKHGNSEIKAITARLKV
jgi:capsular polysaccharide export protein